MDPRNPCISVVIPTFNREKLLPDAIATVLDQEFTEFELIIVDNGSSDATGLMVQQFSDPRIRYHYQDGTGSPAGPRNTGISLAAGDWIAFLDSDDIWDSEKLGQCWEVIRSVDPDLLTHTQNIGDFDGNKLGAMRPTFPSNNPYRFLLTHENTLATSATMVKRSFLVDNNLKFSEAEELVAVEDYDLWLRIAAAGGVLYAMNIPLGTNRVHSDHTGSLELFYRNQKNLMNRHAHEIQDFMPDKEALARRLAANITMMECATLLRSGNFNTSMTKLLHAFKSNSWQPFRYAGYRIRQRVRSLFDSAEK